ncbi:MAG: response regulator [Gammaproteobacteria bacterium]|nr:response regulator [Gammaproteobacteria bacterium]
MTETILVIDDSPTEAKSVTNILESEGFSVEWAKDAAKGIEMAKQLRPQLILMDVVMPGMNGFQATRKIARDPELQDIPIIILTTKDQQTDIVWGRRQGAKAYIIKPAQKQQLLNEINSLLSGQ